MLSIVFVQAEKSYKVGNPVIVTGSSDDNRYKYSLFLGIIDKVGDENHKIKIIEPVCQIGGKCGFFDRDIG